MKRQRLADMNGIQDSDTAKSNGNSENTKSSKRKQKPSVDSILAYAKKVAVNPEEKFDDYSQERLELLRLRDLLYRGPALKPRQKKSGGSTKPRSSSPSSFLSLGDENLPVKSPKEEPLDNLNRVLNLVATRYYRSRMLKFDSKSSDSTFTNGFGGSNLRLKEEKTGKGAKEPPRRITSLGLLSSPIYKEKPEDKWSPREIALFESAICNYGKNFHAIQKLLKNKTTKDVVEFYYVWKKSRNYTIWKKAYKYHYVVQNDE